MDIAEILEKTTRITFEYENKQGKKTEIWVDALEDSLSIDNWVKIQNFLQNEDWHSLAEALAAIVVDWSVKFKKAAFPPSLENLRRVPIPFLMAVINAVGEIWSGNAQTPSESQNGSAGSAKSKALTAV